jgi:hypothetical protein
MRSDFNHHDETGRAHQSFYDPGAYTAPSQYENPRTARLDLSIPRLPIGRHVKQQQRVHSPDER